MAISNSPYWSNITETSEYKYPKDFPPPKIVSGAYCTSRGLLN